MEAKVFLFHLLGTSPRHLDGHWGLGTLTKGSQMLSFEPSNFELGNFQIGKFDSHML